MISDIKKSVHYNGETVTLAINNNYDPNNLVFVSTSKCTGLG